MAFVPCDAVAEVKFIGETDGQETVNDLYFKSTAGPITQVNLAGLVTTLNAGFFQSLAALLSESWSADQIRARDLTSQFSFVAAESAGPTPGGVAGEQAPNNVSANVVFSTGLAGRNLHGSNRVPGIPNSLVTQNTLDTTFLNDIASAYASLVAPATGLPGGWTWVMVSRFFGFTFVGGKKVPTPRAAGVIHEIFSVLFVDAIVDSQKTRLPRHGR